MGRKQRRVVESSITCHVNNLHTADLVDAVYSALVPKVTIGSFMNVMQRLVSAPTREMTIETLQRKRYAREG
jgi:hypothetical protein